MYTITGITGNTGGSVAKVLLGRGQQVRGVTRNVSKANEWRALGAEMIVSELSDVAGMTRAFMGSEGVYIVLPTYFQDADVFASNLRDLASLRQAIEAAGIRRLVFLSSIGADRASGTGAILKLYAMEEAFSDLRIATVSIRAGWFMENFDGLLASVRQSGVLPSFLSPLDLAVPMIATNDIGVAAADLLQQTWSGHRIVELAAATPLSPLDVAAVLTGVLGQKITAAIVPQEAWISTYMSWGLTLAAAEAMVEMIEGFNRRWIVFGHENVETVVGTTNLAETLKFAISSFATNDIQQL